MAGPIAFYKANDTVEGFRILQELGQGAASTIYLAQEPKTKQIYALKHVHRSTEKDDRFLEQALAEYEVGSSVKHPHIREIFKIVKQRAKLFTVLTDVLLFMELVDGISMERKRPRTYIDAVDIFQQTAAGLHAMHLQGYVHADMKPNNVMVLPGPNVKIIDLGQSCKVGVVKPRIQGTPDYIAPEQVERKPITPKTDIYNLGAMMYWTLTKKNIPTALNQGENSLAGKVDASLLPKPTPVSEMDPHCLPKLNELVMHCVEADPEDRPDNMQLVAEKLELILGMLRAKAQGVGGKGGTGDSGLLIDPGSSQMERLDRNDSTSIMPGQS